MSELITKEKLLKLGFKEKIDILDDIYYECIINNDDVIKIILNTKCNAHEANMAMLNQTFGCCDNEFVAAYCDATKANVLKLIEIAKLIGELE